jgi:hypothetical protein
MANPKERQNNAAYDYIFALFARVLFYELENVGTQIDHPPANMELRDDQTILVDTIIRQIAQAIYLGYDFVENSLSGISLRYGVNSLLNIHVLLKSIKNRFPLEILRDTDPFITLLLDLSIIGCLNFEKTGFFESGEKRFFVEFTYIGKRYRYELDVTNYLWEFDTRKSQYVSLGIMDRETLLKSMKSNKQKYERPISVLNVLEKEITG